MLKLVLRTTAVLKVKLRSRSSVKILIALFISTILVVFHLLQSAFHFHSLSRSHTADSHNPAGRSDNDGRSTLASHIRRPQSTQRGLNTKSGIPRIIHQMWKTGSEIPETFRPWIRSWLDKNPEWEYWLWTDEDMRRLVEKVFPRYLSLFNSYPSQSYRVDIFRYFVLYEYGGMYVDLDMECLRTVDSAFEQTDCILSQEPIEHATFLAPVGIPLVSNALMACRPGHPFFAHVIIGLSSYTGWWAWNSVLHATGPYMLTSAYHSYRRGGWFSGNTDPIDIAPADAFHPSPDDSMVDYMLGVCRNSEKRIQRGAVCKRLSGYDFGRHASSTAYTTHHWTHSWVGRRNDPWGLLNEKLDRFNIDELVLTKISTTLAN